MELKKAKLSGTTTETGSGLQHEAAMRVEARYQAEERRRRHLLLMERLKMLLLLWSWMIRLQCLYLKNAGE